MYQLPEMWETAVSSWVGYLKLRGLSVATRRLRRDHIRALARRSEALSPAELTGQQLVMICSAEDWSAEHRKAVRASVKSFYEHCLKMRIATDDVSRWLPQVKAATPNPRPATDDIWDHLLITAPRRELLMARLAAEAGLRRAEVAKVEREDLIADRGGWSLRVRGKGGKQRVVAIIDDLAEEILEYSAGGYLFPGSVEGHISVQYVGQLISQLMPPGWSMHKLRHRFATRGYAGTGNLRAVQEALGHASVATTQRYTAVAATEIRAVAEAAASHGGAA
jgi:integrase